jgi:Zn-dependent oligopeptidase
MDHTVGMRLRKEIYEPGNSRDVGDSIIAFLGRPQTIEPFLENNLGLAPASAPAGKAK